MTTARDKPDDAPTPAGGLPLPVLIPLMPSALYRQVVWSLLLFERFGLSFFYLWYAYDYGAWVWQAWPDRAAWTTGDFTCFARDVTMFNLMLFEGLFLLLSRRAKTIPENFQEIIVPLATSFFYFTYNAIDYLPDWAQDNLLPESWQDGVTITGLGVDALGTAVSFWGVCYLGRSFGIFVAVRQIVLRGPYRLVRHPIYCGYLIMFGGLVLTFFCPAAFVLVAIHYGLFVYRARLEERRLAEFSPEYREYMRTTGFVLPKLSWRRKLAE